LGVTSAAWATFSFSSKRNSDQQEIQETENAGAVTLDLQFSDDTLHNKRTLLNDSAVRLSEDTATLNLTSGVTEDSFVVSDELYSNGNPKSQGVLKNGDPDGVWQYFREDGSLQQLGNFVEGVLDGPWKMFNEQGQIFLEFEQNGDQFKYRRYDPISGYPTIEETRIIKKDLEGYEHDERVGLCTEYYTNGQKRCEGNYAHGKEDGLWYAWHKNGQVKFQGNYFDGNRSGNWQYWGEDGVLDSSVSGYYENDRKQ